MARTRWSVVVSSQTDQALQMFLASQGRRRKGDLSRFIEEAVRAHCFTLSAQKAKSANAGVSEAHLGAMVNEALGWAKNQTGKD